MAELNAKYSISITYSCFFYIGNKSFHFHRHNVQRQGDSTNCCGKKLVCKVSKRFSSGKSISAWYSGQRNFPCLWLALA